MRDLLRNTWYAFFAHYNSLREIQEQAVAPILQGRSVLLASATASGKTEAYMAPLCERWFSDMRQGILRIVVICPTKALTNDLQRRLDAPCARCGIKICLRTGDHPRSIEGVNCGVLLTTLESFDSMLSRHPRTLTTLRAVVADELHVLEGSARGDQLAVLLSRLEKMALSLPNGELQRLAATATIDSHERIAAKYLGENALIVRVPQSRPIRMWMLSMPQVNTIILREKMMEYCRDNHLRKFLFFVPSRALAEQLAGGMRGLPPFGNAVFVHHGSLSTAERERVERSFLNSHHALCLATNTLEVGIDIGDVDMVVLWGPPADVSSFMQRLGRGNRRSAYCRVLAVVSNEAERLRLGHLLQCAEQQMLLGSQPPFRFSVVIQQAFSMTLQNPKRFITAKAIWQRLPLFLRSQYTRGDLERLLVHLCEEKMYFRGAANGHYVPADALDTMLTRGTMHGNISAGGSLNSIRIVDEATGCTLGMAERDMNGKLPQKMRFAGRSLQTVSRQDDNTLIVRSTDEAVPVFSSKGSAPISYALAWDFASYLHLDKQTLPYYIGSKYTYVGHFLGTRLGTLLASFLQDYLGTVKSGPFVLRFKNGFSLEDVEITPYKVQKSIFRHARILMKLLDLGPWAYLLPEDMLHDELLKHSHYQLMCDNLKNRRPLEVSDQLGELFHQLLEK